MVWHVRCAISRLCGRGSLATYFAHQRQSMSDLGYLVIEYVEQGRMLSESWKQHRHDPSRRANLFRGMSRAMISLARVPLPRIGSWTMDNRGVLSLTNRPLTLELIQMENHRIPTNIPRHLTYSSTELYSLDLIATHDSRMRHQPNAIHDEDDGVEQLSALASMRALLPKFTDRQSRVSSFVMSLTDLHGSNFFVDEDWHITRIIDLEWACARPAQMLGAPYWITGRGVDQLYPPYLEDYREMYDEFVKALEEEELAGGHSKMVSHVVRENYGTGRLWYNFALNCPQAVYSIFCFHIQPRFFQGSPSTFDKMLMPLWDVDAEDLIASKVADQEQYDNQIRDMFAAATARVAKGRRAESEDEDEDDEVMDEDKHNRDASTVASENNGQIKAEEMKSGDGNETAENERLVDTATADHVQGGARGPTVCDDSSEAVTTKRKDLLPDERKAERNSVAARTEEECHTPVLEIEAGHEGST